MANTDTFKFTLLHRNSDTSNLIDPFKMVQGIIVGTDGSITESANYATTNFIEVDPSTDYEGHSDSLSSGGAIFFKLVEYDSDYVIIPPSAGGGGTNIDGFTTTASTKYVKLTMRSIAFGSDMKSHALIEGTGTSYIPYYTSRVLRPIYEELERTLSYEKDQKFKIEKLNGDFNLVDGDYDYIVGLLETNIDTQFFIEIIDSLGQMPDLLQEFYLTDLNYNADDRLVTVKSKTANPADEIFRNYKKKIDLSEVVTPLSSVYVGKRSIIQIYLRGASTVTNIRNGEFFEEKIGYYLGYVLNRSLLTGSHRCSRIRDEIVINSGYSSTLSTDVTGTYTYQGDISGHPYYSNGTYRIAVNSINTRWEITSSSGTVLHYASNYNLTGYDPVEKALFAKFSPAAGESGTLYLDVIDMYMRIITNSGVITDTYTSPGTTYPTFARDSSDLAQYKNDYGLVAPLPQNYIQGSGGSAFFYSENTKEFPESTAVKIGKVPEPYLNSGEYYNGLTSTVLNIAIPVCPSSWRSLQVYFLLDDVGLGTFEISNSNFTEFNNGLEVSDVLKVLLRELNIDIMHEGTDTFSEFLYGTLPSAFGFQTHFSLDTLGNTTVSGATKKILISKKAFKDLNTSNISTKLELSLEELFSILDTVYRVKWHVDGRKLILEHAYWYDRGGSYSTNNLAVDTTLIKNPRSGLPWSYSQNKFSFNKIEIPERIETKWIEPSNLLFDGFPVEINSGFSESENVTEKRLEIATNIDEIFYSRRNVTEDGFVMVEAVFDPIQVGGDDYWRAAWTKIKPSDVIGGSVNESDYFLQNGLLSWVHLHGKFYRFDLPTNDVYLNNKPAITSSNITRKKEQDIVFPFISDLSTFGLIRTGLGDGELATAKISMTSRMVEAKVKHDTDL